MNKLIVTLLMIVAASTVVYGVYHDTGMIEWTQPNGVMFMGRGWGDEFAYQYETEDGYRFVRSDDGYYYYATLNSDGDFAASSSKVGIDPPLSSSYKLERSSNRLVEIDIEREAFHLQIETNRAAYFQKRELSVPTSYHIGVLLVDFSNVVGDDSYNRDHFDSLLFSIDWYNTGLTGEVSPDNEEVFGSLHDYYWQQSIGQVVITGKVVNPLLSEFGLKPEWIRLPQSKEYYDTTYSKAQFADTVITRAINDPDFNFTPSSYNHIVIIYAGNYFSGGMLHPGNYLSSLASGYINSEKYSGAGSETFSHIGVHAHEFGHIVGAEDQYDSYPDPQEWSVMDIGNKNGPTMRAECPAGFAPFWRILFGWVNAMTITSDTTLVVEYNYSNPYYFRINAPLDTTEYFIIENRLREGFDAYTPAPYYDPQDPLDPNGNEGGLLIWHFQWPGSADRIEQIEEADADNDPGFPSDPFPYGSQGQDFNDATIPSSHLRNGNNSYVAINNIVWDSVNKTTSVDISPLYNAYFITENTTWGGVVSLDKDVVVLGATLTIQAGTEIQITNPSSEDRLDFKVHSGGNLQLNGMATDSIRVKSMDGLRWGGISVYDSSSAVLDYTIVRDGKMLVDIIDTLGVVSIGNCNITNPIKIGDNYGTLTIENSRFVDAGLLNSGGNSLVIEDCDFIRSGVDIFYTVSGRISYSLFESDGLGTGLNLSLSSQDAFEVNNNVISNWQVGISLGFPSAGQSVNSLTIRNNIIMGCSTGIQYLSGSPVVAYNDFWSNMNNGYVGSNYFLYDPSFVDSTNGDYHLRYESLLIDAGDTTSDFSNEPEPNGDRINIGRYGNTSEATITTTPGATVSGTEQWTGDRYLSGDILIMPGGHLTVDPGVTVYFVPNYDATGSGPNRLKGDIVVQGQLTLQGTQTLPVTIASYTTTPSPGDWGTVLFTSPTQATVQYAHISEATDGITFEREGYGTVNNSTIENCDVGLKVTSTISPNISFTNNTLINDSLGIHLFMADATLDGNTISNNVEGIKVEQGVGYSIRNNTIENNDTYGIHLVQSSDGTLDGNIIQSNGLQDSASVSGGIFLHASSPVLENNTINENRPHGITAMNRSQPVMNKGGRALNHIEANGTRYVGPGPGQPENAELLFYDSSYPVLSRGHNDIFDLGGGYLIYGKDVVIPTKPVDITYNYWAVEEPALGDHFYPDIFKYIPYDRTPNTGSSPSNPLWSGSQAMYQQGITQESEGNWSGAIETYQNLITTYPDSMEAQGSVVRLFVCTRENGGDYQALQTYYDELKVTYPDTQLMKAADQYSILCHLPREEYSAAIEKYETVLSNPPSLEDSVYAVIDIGQVYLIADASGTGGLGRQAPLGTMLEYRPIDHTDYSDKVSNALADLFGNNRKEDLAVPERFALHQNYPNPFNPTTTILFDLPERGHVNLVVYDILGREIATIIDQELIAGYHRVVWDASNVATGIYFYRLIFEKGIRTRKLVVLK